MLAWRHRFHIALLVALSFQLKQGTGGGDRDMVEVLFRTTVEAGEMDAGP